METHLKSGGIPMGLSSPIQKSGKVYYFEAPRPKTLWRHRVHDLLTQAMIVGGGCVVVYEFLIRPIMRHLN